MIENRADLPDLPVGWTWSVYRTGKETAQWMAYFTVLSGEFRIRRDSSYVEVIVDEFGAVVNYSNYKPFPVPLKVIGAVARAKGVEL